MICTFFGHRECCELDTAALKIAIEGFIQLGAEVFLVGHQGQFDCMVYRCLKQLRRTYPHIQVCVVLAYLPTKNWEHEDMTDTMYPEIEGHPKYAVDRRNRWMIEQADYCLCYICHTWGGAYKYARMAKRRGLTVVNLGHAQIG